MFQAELLIIDTAISMVYAILALLGLFYGLRFLDRKAGRSFDETMEIIRNEALPTSIYYGMRWLGACIVIACFILR